MNPTSAAGIPSVPLGGQDPTGCHTMQGKYVLVGNPEDRNTGSLAVPCATQGAGAFKSGKDGVQLSASQAGLGPQEIMKLC